MTAYGTKAYGSLGGRIGWLAPDGTYYACMAQEMHVDVAHEIISDIFKLDPATLPDSSTYNQRIDSTLGLTGYRSYGFLRHHGYIRVDTKAIEPECPMTFEQLIALVEMNKTTQNKDWQAVIDKHHNSNFKCDEEYGGFDQIYTGELTPPTPRMVGN